MHNRWAISGIILLVIILAGCGAESQQGALASAPRPTVPAIIRPASETTFVELADLVASPSLYRGQYLRLTGRYQPQPLIVCRQGLRPSPAPWNLTDGENSVRAGGGFDHLLRPLADQNLTLTVEGRWLQWQGPIGCGKQATQTAFWYLAVNEIISPNPIVRPGVLAAGDGDTGAGSVGDADEGDVDDATAVGQPTASATPTLPAVESLTTPTKEAADTPDTLPTIPPPTEAVTATPTLIVTATGTVAGTPTITVTIDPAATATATSDPNATATPTATAGPSPTTGPTTSPVPSEPVDQDMLEAQAVGKSRLEAGEIHRWQFVLSASNTVTVSVAPAPDRDLQFSIVDPAGNVVIERNNAAAGQPESVANLSLTAAGTYDVLVRDVNNAPGNYAILFLHSQSYTFLFKPSLKYGGNPAVSLAADNDHFWNFDAAAGDNVTIRVTPDDAETEMYIELYGPDMTLINCDVVDSGSGIITKVIDNCVLPEEGFYTVRVGEYDFQAANYDIAVTKQ